MPADDLTMGGTDNTLPVNGGATSAGALATHASTAGASTAGASSAGASTAGRSTVGGLTAAHSGTTPAAAGPAVNGIDILGGRVKKLVQAIDKLQSLGIETTDRPLPKIVVVGDQSAGKSSLIEGISGIRVPRSSGTCTRCPLQITLTPTDAEWSCNVTIQKNYDYYHNVGDAEAVWDKKDDPQEIQFAKTYDKAALEDLIHRAQIAVLNPREKPARFLHSMGERTVAFSPNIVKLEIRERASPSLSFIDLPGVITQTEDAADMWHVKLVKEMVEEYISHEHTLILLACSMESDMGTSHSSRIVADCPGAKDRCVGVLTKPDRRPADNSFDDVRRVLENKSFRVGHGYFVAMQPGQLQLNVSTDVARKNEAAFFAKPGWSTLQRLFPDRFGTEHLQKALAHKLADRIIASLPDIAGKISSEIERTEKELQSYPDPPANALSLTIEALTVFRLNTRSHLDGIPPNNDFRNTVRDQSVQFRKCLIDLKPTVKLTTPVGYLPTKEVIDLCDSDEDLGESPPRPSAKRPRTAYESQSTPTPIRAKMAPQTPQTPVPKMAAPRTPQMPVPTAKQESEAKSFTLLEIRKTLEDLTSSDIPGEIDPNAVDNLRLQCLSGWEKAMNNFIDETATVVQHQLGQVLREACKTREATEFYRQAVKVFTNFVEQSMFNCREQCRWALRLELFKPMTLNETGLNREKNEALDGSAQGFAKRRYWVRAKEHLVAQEAKSGKSMSMAERNKKIETDKDLRVKLGPDPFQREIEVMAKVRGYYSIAMYRFLDRVVQETQQGLETCRQELHDQLMIGLELNGEKAHETAVTLLAEDPEREVQRMSLKNHREKLMQAQVWLQGLDVDGSEDMEMDG